MSRKSEAFVAIRRPGAPGIQGCAKQLHIPECIAQYVHHSSVILWRVSHGHLDVQGSLGSLNGWCLAVTKKWNAIAKVVGGRGGLYLF